MPIISMFYGIIIRLYLIDNKNHNLPHIHAKYVAAIDPPRESGPRLAAAPAAALSPRSRPS